MLIKTRSSWRKTIYIKYPTWNFIVLAKVLSKEHPGGFLSKVCTIDWTVTGRLLKILMFQRQPSENIRQKIYSSYRKVPNTILWKIFSKFLIFFKREKYFRILREATCDNYFIIKCLFKSNMARLFFNTFT